jgi:hypothetical protein
MSVLRGPACQRTTQSKSETQRPEEFVGYKEEGAEGRLGSVLLGTHQGRH